MHLVFRNAPSRDLACRIVFGIVAFLILFGSLTGCSANFAPELASAGSNFSAGSLRGNLHGGQAPIYNAKIYLLQTGLNGYPGSNVGANTSVISSGGSSFGGTVNGTALGSYVLTDVTGNFTIPGFTCTPGAGVYLYSVGGDPISNTTNSAATLMAAMGICPAGGASALAASVPYVNVNEVSTVAMAYALEDFTAAGYDASHISSAASNASGLANAFALSAALFNVSSGGGANTSIPGSTNPGMDQSTLNTLGNMLAGCVNSDGSTSSNDAPCYLLFQNATSSGITGGDTVPTDTASAAINMMHHPQSNVAALDALADNNYSPFTPIGSSPPASFTLTVGNNFYQQFSPSAQTYSPVAQISVPLIEGYPKLPVNYTPVNWATRTLNYAQTVAGNTNPATNPFLAQGNCNGSTIWAITPYAVVNPGSTPAASRDPEAISTFPTLLDLFLTGQTTNGVYQGVDWINNSVLGFRGLAGTTVPGGTGGHLIFDENLYCSGSIAGPQNSLWYQIWTNMTAADLAAVSGNATLQADVVTAAQGLQPILPLFTPLSAPTDAAWQRSPLYEASIWFDFGDYATTDYTAANSSGQNWPPGPNDYPQASVGIAYVDYFAYLFTHQSSYLKDAEQAYAYYNSLPSDIEPGYEVVNGVAPYVAARMNAEQNTSYDISKAITFNLANYPDFQHDVRINWGGLTSAQAPGFEGLMSSTSYSPGTGYYAFAMNTMSQVGYVIPVAKYQPAYARIVARYAFVASNSAKAFWGDLVPDSNQIASQLTWMATWDPNRTVSYESAHIRNGQAYPTCDFPPAYSTPYGSAWVGFMSGIVPVNGASGNPLFEANINKTDFMGGSLQRYLIYNPASGTDQLTLTLPTGSFNIWDSVNKQMVASSQSAAATVSVGGDSAVVLTLIPATDFLTVINNQLIDVTTGEIIDYQL